MKLNFRIVQLEEDCFIIQKQIEERYYKYHLWPFKSKRLVWKTIKNRENKYFNGKLNLFSNDAGYKSFELAQKALETGNKYPKVVYTKSQCNIPKHRNAPPPPKPLIAEALNHIDTNY
ncbi:hypothetical protein [Chryseobacterium sp. M5A1_1a]